MKHFMNLCLTLEYQNFKLKNFNVNQYCIIYHMNIIEFDSLV